MNRPSTAPAGLVVHKPIPPNPFGWYYRSVKNPLLYARPSTANWNPLYRHTSATINNDPELLKKYLISLTEIEDELNRDNKILREGSSDLIYNNPFAKDHQLKLQNMMQKVNKFQNTFQKHKDRQRIQPYFNALKKRVHNHYLTYVNDYMHYQSKKMPRFSVRSARHAQLAEACAQWHIKHVANTGGVPKRHAMQKILNLNKQQTNREQGSKKIMNNVRKVLPPELLYKIYQHKKKPIPNKLMEDMYGLMYGSMYGSRRIFRDYQMAERLSKKNQVLKNIENGLVSYIIDAENKQIVRNSKDHVVSLPLVGILLNRLSKVMNNAESPLSEKEGEAIASLTNSSRKRWNLLVNRAITLGKQKRNERNARLAQSRPPTPTASLAPGRLGTPLRPPPDIFVNSTGRRL